MLSVPGTGDGDERRSSRVIHAGVDLREQPLHVHRAEGGNNAAEVVDGEVMPDKEPRADCLSRSCGGEAYVVVNEGSTIAAEVEK